MRIGVGRKKLRMGDLLVAAGAITEEQLQQALTLQKEKGQKFLTDEPLFDKCSS